MISFFEFNANVHKKVIASELRYTRFPTRYALFYKILFYLCRIGIRIINMGSFLSFWSDLGKHKIWILCILFGLHIIFIDENNILKRIEARKEIIELKKEIEKYNKEYETSTKMLEDLTSNPEFLENIARERYFMKKPDEDIYVFED